MTTDRMERPQVECVECGEYSIPRAVVAISDDRQWLVTPDPNGPALGGSWWLICRWEETIRDVGWMVQDPIIEDTGQSADDVLREWLEQQK